MPTTIIIGAVLGFLLGGPVGALIGGSLGWWVRHLRVGGGFGGSGAVQKQFLDSTFAVMGALCKVDGQVSRDEIRAAEQLFARLHLNAGQRADAKAAFNRGKAPGFDLDGEIAAFVRVTRGNRALYRVFVHVQITAIAADGRLDPAEHDMLVRIARGLGLSAADIARLEAMLGGATGGARMSPQQATDNAYKVLGVSANASNDDIKKAYRRLMSENHPDKLAARGLPESMRQMAEDKTQEIGNAYDIIKQARGFT